jgi:hypothetical protein
MKRQIIRYWGRKPSELAQHYIGLYSKPGEIVADTFGGSGIFVDVALELGRKAIYVDLNPFAELIAHSLIGGCDVLRYQQAVQKILARDSILANVGGEEMRLEPRKLFHVRCTCERSIEAKSIFFTRIYQVMSTSSTKVNGIRDEVVRTIQKKGLITHEDLCAAHKNIHTQSLSNIVKQLVRQGVIVEKEMPISAYLLEPCRCGRKEIIFKNENIWAINGPIKPYYWYPVDSLEYENGEPFLKKRDVLRVNELFLDRSLAILSAIWDDICSLKVDRSTKRCLKLTFMATLARSSKMCRRSGGTWPINSYWIPRNFIVKNPYIVFENAANQMINFTKNKRKFKCGRLKDVVKGDADVTFLVTDSTKLNMPESSVDYVIIDPPHTDEAQFLELSVFYTSWLKQKLPFENELIVNAKQGKTLNIYMRMLKEAAKKVHHILKPNKYFTVILHEEDLSILKSSIEAICSVGFQLVKDDKEGDYNIYTFLKQGSHELKIDGVQS